MSTYNIKTPLVDTLIDDIKDTQMIVREFTYKCKPSSKIISRFAKGYHSSSLSLSQQYLSHLTSEATKFESEIIKPFSSFCPHIFLLNVGANSAGELEADNIKVELRVSCPKIKSSVVKTFKEPLNILLPFAEYLEKVTIGVFNFRVNNVVAEFTISAEELKMVMENPITYDKLAAQWLTHFKDVYQRGNSVYSFESTIDVFEGKMYTDEVNFDVRTNFPKK